MRWRDGLLGLDTNKSAAPHATDTPPAMGILRSTVWGTYACINIRPGEVK